MSNDRNQIYKKRINLKYEKVKDDVLENSIYELQNNFNIKPNFDVYYYEQNEMEVYELEIEYLTQKYYLKISTMGHIYNLFKITSAGTNLELKIQFMMDTAIQELLDYSLECFDILERKYPFIYHCKTKKNI